MSHAVQHFETPRYKPALILLSRLGKAKHIFSLPKRNKYWYQFCSAETKSNKTTLFLRNEMICWYQHCTRKQKNITDYAQYCITKQKENYKSRTINLSVFYQQFWLALGSTECYSEFLIKVSINFITNEDVLKINPLPFLILVGFIITTFLPVSFAHEKMWTLYFV